MTAALQLVWSPAEFEATLAAAALHVPESLWSREGAALAAAGEVYSEPGRVVIDFSDGGVLLVPWAPLASRGRRYRGEHRRGAFRRRGLTVADIEASL